MVNKWHILQTAYLLHAEDTWIELLLSFILCGQRQDLFPVLVALHHCVDVEVPADTLHEQIAGGLQTGLGKRNIVTQDASNFRLFYDNLRNRSSNCTFLFLSGHFIGEPISINPQKTMKLHNINHQKTNETPDLSIFWLKNILDFPISAPLMSSQGCQVPHVATTLVLEEVVQVAGRTALIAVHLQFWAGEKREKRGVLTTRNGNMICENVCKYMYTYIYIYLYLYLYLYRYIHNMDICIL